MAITDSVRAAYARHVLGADVGDYSVAAQSALLSTLSVEFRQLVEGTAAVAAQEVALLLEMDPSMPESQETAEMVSALFSAAEYSAKATAVLDPFASRIEALVAGLPQMPVGETALRIAAHGVLKNVLRREFGLLRAKVTVIRATSESSRMSRDHARFAFVLAAASEQVVRLAQESLDASDVVTLRAKLRLLESISQAAADSDLFVLTKRLRGSVDELLKNGLTSKLSRTRSRFSDSYWNQVAGPGAPNPIFELWPSQVKAIDDGFLTQRSWVLSLPTSSGKTFLAELKIAALLSVDPRALVVYVAPYNALAAQVTSKLRERLAPSGLANALPWTGAYEIDPDIQDLGNLLVMTPEKLDSVLRSSLEEDPRSADLQDRLKLVILDECHAIGSGARGLAYELLVSRLKARLPNVELFAMSAVLGNPDNLSLWLSGQSDQNTVSTWRPTDTQVFILNRSGSVVDESGTHVATTKKWTQPKKATASVVERLVQSGHWPVLILESQRGYAESAAEECSSILSNDDWPARSDSRRAIEQLRLAVVDLMGEESPLSARLQSGVAFHHGAVPAEIRRDIESLIRRRFLRVVASTTTLAEGVDLPFRAIVIPHLTFDTQKMPRPLFQNIVGRAGRAFVGTTGTVVLLEPDDDATDQYLRKDLVGLRNVPVTAVSQLPGVALDPWKPEAWKLKWRLEAQLFGLVADETHGEDQAGNFLASTFAATSGDAAWKHAVRRRMRLALAQMEMEPPLATAASPLRLTELGRAACMTGLGIASIRILHRELQAPSATPLQEASWRRSLQDDVLDAMVRLSFSPLEAFTESLGIPGPYTDLRIALGKWMQGDNAAFDAVTLADRQLMRRWVRGESLKSISQERQERGPLRKKSATERLADLTQYYSRASGFASWMYSGAVRIADYMRNNSEALFPEEIRLGVDMLRFGVDSAGAASLVAVADVPREAAVLLARSYETDEGEQPPLILRVLEDGTDALARHIEDPVLLRRTQKAVADYDPFRRRERVALD